MRQLPLLSRQLLPALAIVFAGAVVVAAAGLLLLMPAMQTPALRMIYLGVLLLLDLAIFLAFGHSLVERRVLAPVRRMIEGAEAIAAGDYTLRLPEDESAELARLAQAVNQLAERLISHQESLAENVRSLQETNEELAGAEDAIVRAEKMASVGRLAAGLAHEVGNPLGAILGYLGLIARGVEESRKPLVQSAEREARRIDRIVRGLLDYARVRDARPQPIGVNAVIEQSVELITMQGRFSGIDLQLRLLDDLPLVEADPHQLQQVLVNLLVNAADALEGRPDARLVVGSTMRLRDSVPQLPPRRRDDPPGVDYSHRRRHGATGKLPREAVFLPPGEVVEISVQDNGPGVPPELLAQIFEPFVTTKEPGKGTGLGLAVSARLVDGMGGTMTVDAAPGGGALFRILLPPESAAAETDGASPMAASAVHAGRA